MWCGSGTIIQIHVDSDPFRFAGSCPACSHFINIHVLSGPFCFAGSCQACYHFVSCDQWSINVSCDPATSVLFIFSYVVLSARVSILRLFFHFRSRHEFVISPAFVAATSMFLRFMFFQSFGRWLYGQLRHALRVFDCGFPDCSPISVLLRLVHLSMLSRPLYPHDGGRVMTSAHECPREADFSNSLYCFISSLFF